MFARIYRPAKNAMQSGFAKTAWVLEFEPSAAKRIDPLMGWTGSTDMNGQVRLTFDSAEAASAYATAHHIPHQVITAPAPKRILKAYADNFATYRREPWTH
jgi:hypothetical protein